jgi:RNA polymerase primary sigma factor
MYQQGVESALEALIIKNMQLVGSRVQRYIKVYNHKLDEDDLLQCGVIGMINAVKKFDVKMETRFTTYAIWWIDQSILRNIIDYGFAIRIPVYRFQEVGDLMKVFKAYPHSSKEQIYELLKEERGLSRDRFEELIGLLHNILSMASLNRYVGEDEDSELGDFVVDEVSSTVEEMVEEKEMKRILNDVLETITEREEKIIRLRFGLDDGKERTLEQVGNVFGVTRERIRQIEAKALRKLRHPTRSKKLRSFLYGD